MALVLIAGFIAFAIDTSIAVRTARSAVETRVGWLRELSAMSRELHACGAEREALLERAAAIASSISVEPPARRACDEAQLTIDREAVAALEGAIRRQTGQLSQSLGDQVDRLFWVAIAACVTALGLGILLVVLGRMRRALDAQARLLGQQALEMADRERALRTSAAIIAHEINNPLMFLRLSAEVARRDITSSESESIKEQSMDELLEAAIEAGDRIGVVARDLRDLGRQDPAIVEPVDIGELVEQTRRLVTSRSRAARLDIELTPVPRVNANAARLGQALLNLLRNAEDASLGVTSPRVAVRVSSDGPWVKIEVLDNGVGIPKAVAARLFMPFVTTKGARGTGLGLYVSRTIVESFGGTLTLTSEPSTGTVATIRLPVAAPEDHALTA